MLSLLFPLLLCISAVYGQSSDPIILLNCGSPSAFSKSEDNRTWNGDSTSEFLSSSSQNSFETTEFHSSSVPYMTSRISQSKLAYYFPISPGPKFIRLYFYPTTYSSSSSSSSSSSIFDASDSYFSVTANNFTLLKNFSASLHLLDTERVDYKIIKEFIVTVHQNQTLNLTFTPNPSSLVFINGIEIVPIPDLLYIKGTDQNYNLVTDQNYNLVNYQKLFTLNDSTALQNIYRLNVGGRYTFDTEIQNMFRSWEDDTDYLYYDPNVVQADPENETIKYTDTTPSYTAPEDVYRTVRTLGPDPKYNLKHNLTWTFSVESGFYYLLRLHFCETEMFVNASHQRVFSIFINNMTANEALDVFDYAGGRNIPVYQDFIVLVPEGTERKHDLWLALHPLSDVIFVDAFLNGLEIFKLNKSNGDLSSGLNPLPESSHSKFGVLPIIGAVLGVAIFMLALVICFFVYRRKAKDDTPLLLTDLCRRFAMPELKTATRNFSNKNVVGSGGFGTVYKGFIENGSLPVAIKRLDSLSKQGVREFHTEIQMLSKLRHAHLVSLIGYCDDEDEMILVYEFMDNGNLQEHIHKAKKIPPTWKQRLQICIGAAKGLHYLHTGTKYPIIHRDVKSSNILLDSNWVAKISDFGLSKMGPMSESQTHVSTNVKGSFGYLDPEYFRRQQLTEKSDVYSFGVVLLEVVYGRPPIVLTNAEEEVNLVEWARKCSKKGITDQHIDPQLKGVDIAMISLNKFMEIAESCVHEKGTERPTMSDVVWGLEFCLQLQETTKKNLNDGEDASDDKSESWFQAYKGESATEDKSSSTSSGASMLSIGENSYRNNDSGGMRPENVFSEIMNRDGR